MDVLKNAGQLRLEEFDESDHLDKSSKLSAHDANIIRHRNIDDNLNQALYRGAEITVGQSMLIILSLFFHFNLSISFLETVITALQMHCLSEQLVKNNVHNFKIIFVST